MKSRRTLQLLLVAVAASLTAAEIFSAGGAATADPGVGFVEVKSPPGPSGVGDGGPVAGFAASGHTWFVVLESHEAWISHDRGEGWRRVNVREDDTAHSSRQAPALVVAGPAVVGPDGNFYVGATVSWSGAGSGVPEILRVTPAGAVSRLWVRLPPSDYGAQPLPFFDVKHRLWLELDRNGKQSLLISVIRVESDLSAAERIYGTLPAKEGIVLRVETAGGDTYFDTDSSRGGNVLRLAGGKLEPISGGLAPTIRGFGFAYGALYPVLAEGRTVVGTRGISFDGGESWGGLWGPPVEPVEGSSSLLERLLPTEPRPPKLPPPYAGRILTQFSPGVWRVSGLGAPRSYGSLELFQTEDGIVALGEFGGPTGARGFHSLEFYPGAIPALPESYPQDGGLERSLVARVNHFRAEASLPPFESDALIAKAAANHARYLALNHISADQAGAYHTETPGRPGYTGRDAGERCAAVGVSCSQEVIESGAEIDHPVDDWIASVYHRLPLTSPVTAAAGAGRFGKYVVMDLDDADRRGFSLKPLGFPVGRYDGRLSAIHELPNPLDNCARHGDVVRRPGAPITFQTPTEEPPSSVFNAYVQEFPLPDVLGITVRRGGDVVPGCTQVSTLSSPLQNFAFIPAGPLAPHTTYQATARWRINRLAPVQTFSWQFTTATSPRQTLTVRRIGSVGEGA